MRRSVFYTMTQAERRGRLHCSSWPDLNWENDWIMLSTYDDFDRSIPMDARSGKLQKVFDIPYNGPYDVETPRTVPEDRMRIEDVDNGEDAKEYLQQVKNRNIEKWSNDWNFQNS